MMKVKTDYNLKKIKGVLTWVLSTKSPKLYKEKYKKVLPVKIKDIDFTSLPFLTRTELESVDPYDRLFIPEKEVVVTKLTSGTSGKPLILFQEKEDPFAQTQYWETLQRYNVKKLFYLVSTQQVYVRLIDRISDKRQQTIPVSVGDINNLPLSAQIASLVGVDAIETNASILYFLIPHLREVYDLSKIKFISLGGEYTSRLKLNYFKKSFPKALFDFRFGSAETRMRGYRCQYLAKKPPQLFHPSPRYYYEAVDSTGKPLSAGHQGELVLTSLEKMALPLIKYKTGDLVVLRNQPCSCMEQVTFELLGRSEKDFIKIQGAILYPQMIDKALAKIKHLIEPDYQLHLYETIYQGKPLPYLKLDLVIKTSQIPTPDLTKIISDNLYLSSSLNLTQLVEKKIFLPLQINWVKQLDQKSKAGYIVNHIK